MELWKRLEQTKKPIVLYGMGNGADKIIDILNKRGVSVAGVFASDDFVRHQNFRGFTVKSYHELCDELGEMVVLVAFGTQRKEVLENILRIAREQEVYVPDVPVIGNALFTEEFLKSHRNEFEKVYNLLSDNRSKEVFENIIFGKLTGEIHYLLKAEDRPQDCKNLLPFSDDEVFLDLGAYTGDTVMEFIQDHPQYNKIIAVEPDFKNCKKCKENLRGFSNIQIVNACIDADEGERCFLMDGGRKSASLSGGGIAIPAVSVDALMQNERVSYIKMDVEGMEREALMGAKSTLLRWRPKMLVSAYHRSEDLFLLPLLVKEMAGEFDLYLRHFPYLPAWDTNFYFNLLKL